MPINRPRPGLASGAALVTLLAACSTYVPVTSPASSSTVRARLTVEEALRRSEGSGEPVRTVRGRVVRYDGQELHLDVLLARSASEFRRAEFRDTLVIPRTGLESVAERRLSPWRTALAAAGLAGAVYLIVDRVLVGGGGDDGPGNGETRQARIPLLAIPLGR